MKKTLQNIVLAGSLGLVTALNGCSNDNYKSVSQPTVSREVTEKEDYAPTLEDFKRVLGDRYIPEREDELGRFWKDEVYIEESPEQFAELLIQLYKEPKKIKQKIVVDELRRRCEDSYIYSVPFSKLKEVQKEIPWRVLPRNYETLSQIPEDYKFPESDEILINAYIAIRDSSFPIPVDSPFGDSPLGEFSNYLLGF